MTERFCVENNTFYENDWEIENYDKVADRLNELYELNIELKRINKRFREENQKLKKELSEKQS